MMILNIGDVAARLTQSLGEYIPTHRVYATVRRLIDTGEITERRAGRQHLILNSELSIIESEFGVTDPILSIQIQAA